MVVLLREFYFSRVELPYSGYLVVFVDNCRCLSLSLRENYVYEVLRRGNNSNLLEIIMRHLEQSEHVVA